MITLNKERGFLKVNDWTEIQELQGYVVDLNPEKQKLKEVLAGYFFKEKINCGLSTCHQPHQKGFVVSTEEGHVTNIGNVCGKNHFGVEFTQLTKQHQRDVEEHNNRMLLTSFLFQIEGWLDEIQTIYDEEKGAKWLQAQKSNITNRGRVLPDEVVTYINGMARSRNPEIQAERIATKEEVEEVEAMMDGKKLPKPHYVQEAIANLDGLPCLYPENDLREILVKDLKPNLESLSELDVDSADFRTLKDWAKWCNDFEDKLENAKEAIKQGRLLFTVDNLSPFLQVAKPDSNTDDFRQYLKSLS